MNSTIDFYNTNARSLISRYDNADMRPLYGIFDRYLLQSHTVLDIGFGSGRDLLYLNRKNICSYGIDGSTEFVQQFQNKYTDLCNKVFHSILPKISLSDNFKGSFDAIISVATWMHLPKEEHFEAILNIKQFLKANGIVILSYSTSPRRDDPRFFEEINPDKIALLFESFGFTMLESNTNSDGLDRESIEWVTQVYKLDEGSQKGIDQIESILSQDSKDTTYKYALLKAFAEIATSPLNRFSKFSDDYVYFPIGIVAEKWIETYWKLMDSEIFIPQKKGGEKNKKLAFRPLLEDLIAHYRLQKNKANPYYEFWTDYQKGVCKESKEYELLRNLFNMVIQTIIEGPVKFSGSSFDDKSFFTLGEGSKTFSKKHIEFNAKTLIDHSIQIGIKKSAYHELYRYGTWISDSITLRWAKFTERLISQSNLGYDVSFGQIMSMLTTDFVHERETTFARKIYDEYQLKKGYLSSVWSNTKLNTYEVDHVLPYSVYSNNDLWNLLPASRNENNAKRDALVSTDLVRYRRNTIIEYWEYMQERSKNKFNNEIYKTFNIDPLNNQWKDSLLLAICEQIEITASLRGLKRWAV